jgi:pimeloyl-ACP methyl ester carboxylesterase
MPPSIASKSSKAPIPDADSTRRATRDSGSGLPPALNAERSFIWHQGLRVALYLSMPQNRPSNALMTPLVLVHSINAAASAAEVKPIFERYADERPVLAIELPGFGASDRKPVEYTPQLMMDCITRAVEHLRELGFQRPVDLLAVSLSCEIAARAVLDRPAAFRSVALVSPTGFESRRPEPYEDGRTKDKPWLRRLLESGPWSNALFVLLTSEKSMRKFLERTWGSKDIDEELLAYNLLTVAQPGARHAPYAFIGGALFTRGVRHLYAQLTVPVWMIHGCRGEFAKVDGLKQFTPLGRWTIEPIDAGAMPYFEHPADFALRYDAFIEGLERARRL